MVQYRQELQSAASELASQYDQIKAEAQRRLSTLYSASDYPTTLDGLFDLEGHRAAATQGFSLAPADGGPGF